MTDGGAPARRLRSGAVALAVVAGLLLSSAAVWGSTEAAFTAPTSNGPNTWATGAVALTDTSSGTLTDQTLQQGASTWTCVTVTYTGTITPAPVRLYVSGLSDPYRLAKHLTITVAVADGAVSCAATDSFTSAYSGTLADLSASTSIATGVAEWTPPVQDAQRTYLLRATLDSLAPSEVAASFTYVWEARG